MMPRMSKLPAAGEIGIALLVVTIISLMILPLPTEVIDALLAFNITISVTLLMVTIYVSDIVHLSSFPSLLLFTTLYRLSLNIASTKSILLHADAGTIIESFGELVVGGNLVVGLVVFAIITTVQFIVIAKGSERVAEVGARFTLDALPGKQMSIDADLRANAITADEARKRRGALGMESKLHGGMDGAMKFVKGDAIAGLLITLINIVAGIAVGMMYHGMSSGEAANRFSILSIGDAMVSQIPSLLISVSAGVIITRVADDMNPRGNESLGDEIGRQLSANGRALYLSAVLLVGFALVPGFPTVLFLAIAACLALGAYKLTKREKKPETTSAKPLLDDAVTALQRAGSKRSAPAILSRAPELTCPIGVRLGHDLASLLAADSLHKAFDTRRAALTEELGLPFPGITMWSADSLEPCAYEILIHDVPYAKRELAADKPTLIDGSAADCPEAAIAAHTMDVMRDHASLFIGIQETQWVLDKLNDEYPGLVTEVQKVVPAQRIAEVLRRLLEEYVSIRNARNIMESLIHWGPKEKDTLLLTEYVRGDLSRFMAYRAARGSSKLPVVLFDIAVEQHLRQLIKQTPTGNYLALSPDQSASFIAKIAQIAGSTPREDRAVVTSMDIRRYVRRMIESDLRWLPVYSYQELGNLIELQPLGKVTL
ncbi:FHIPEP family type III secretion protein [Trinickia sp. LjRoot230]|uniref:FHIPEP family type III secretion protein n=1 Tax=Trinickia sp. LjRoot230 TaxID=3342288 RepID=UPI003F4F4C6C